MSTTMGTLYFSCLKLRCLKLFKKKDWIASAVAPIYFFQAILKWLQTTLPEIHTWYVPTKLDGPGRAIQVILTLLFAVEILLQHQVSTHSLYHSVMSKWHPFIPQFPFFNNNVTLWNSILWHADTNFLLNGLKAKRNSCITWVYVVT